MLKNNSNKFAFAYRLVDLSVLCLMLYVSLALHGVNYKAEYITIALIAMVSFSFCSESFSLYRSWRSGYFIQTIFYTLSSWLIAVGGVLTFLFFSKTSIEYSRVALGLWFLLTSLTLVAWRACYNAFLYRIRLNGYNTRSVAILGLSEAGLQLAQEMVKSPHQGYRLAAIFEDRSLERMDEDYRHLYKGKLKDAIVPENIEQYDVVFICLPLAAQKRVTQLLQAFSDTSVDVQVVPDLYIFGLLHGEISHVGDVQTINVFSDPMTGGRAAIKRGEDILLSLAILTLIALPMMIIATGVKLTSRGPALFKQDRYGLDGKKIKVWKFRSMTVAENGDKVTQATKNDTRITPFGAFLRRTSLDELPQFLNVLTGSMSVVGPRPHAVAHNEEYRKQVSYYMLRHRVKPGITGWAQINGWRGETDTLDKMEQRVNHDLEYIRNWSVWMDIKIVFFTIFRGFNDKNAY